MERNLMKLRRKRKFGKLKSSDRRRVHEDIVNDERFACNDVVRRRLAKRRDEARERNEARFMALKEREARAADRAPPAIDSGSSESGDVCFDSAMVQEDAMGEVRWQNDFLIG